MTHFNLLMKTCPLPRGAGGRFLPRTIPAALASLVLLVSPAQEGPIQCRANLFVIDPGPEDEKGSGKRVITYSPEITPGPEKQFRIFADSSAPAAILIAAFDRKSALLLREAPPVLTIGKTAYSSVSFPSRTGRIAFLEGKPVDFFVVSMAPDHEKLPELGRLIAAIHRSAGDGTSETFAHQSHHLKGLIDDWIRSTNPKEFTLRNPEPATAGLRRGATIAWQEHAHRFSVPGDRPAVRLFRAGEPQP